MEVGVGLGRQGLFGRRGRLLLLLAGGHGGCPGARAERHRGLLRQELRERGASESLSQVIREELAGGGAGGDAGGDAAGHAAGKTWFCRLASLSTACRAGGSVLSASRMAVLVVNRKTIWSISLTKPATSVLSMRDWLLSLRAIYPTPATHTRATATSFIPRMTMITNTRERTTRERSAMKGNKNLTTWGVQRFP